MGFRRNESDLLFSLSMPSLQFSSWESRGQDRLKIEHPPPTNLSHLSRRRLSFLILINSLLTSTIRRCQSVIFLSHLALCHNLGRERKSNTLCQISLNTIEACQRLRVELRSRFYYLFYLCIENNLNLMGDKQRP